MPWVQPSFSSPWTDRTHRRYHSHINKDPNATIGEWDASHTRVITFVPNVPLPAVAKRAIGANRCSTCRPSKLPACPPACPQRRLCDCVGAYAGLEGSGVKVQEKQQLNYQPEQRRAVLTSASNPMVKGGERFMTRVQATALPSRRLTLPRSARYMCGAPALNSGGS